MKIYVKITVLFLSVLFLSTPLFSCAGNTPSVIEPITEPITDPVTEPVTEPITEPITDPITEPITNPSTDVPDNHSPEILNSFISRMKTLELTSTSPLEVTLPTHNMSVEEQDALLQSLYYKDAHGYVRIAGSDNIRLPSSGRVVTLNDPNNTNCTLDIFIYDELSTTVASPDIPAYSAGGTNGTNCIVERNQKLWFSFDCGETLIPFPDDVCELYFDPHVTVNIDYWYSEGNTACAVLVVPNRDQEIAIIITTTNKGESINTAVYNVAMGGDTYNGCVGISFVSDDEFFLVFTQSYWSMGRFSYVMLKTLDGGQSFFRIEGNYGGKNTVFLDRYTYVHTEQFEGDCLSKNSILPNVCNYSTEMWRSNSGILEMHQYPFAPFFDGEFGIVAVGILLNFYSKPVVNTFSESIKYISGYIYYISTDNGNTWSLYNPSIIR